MKYSIVNIRHGEGLHSHRIYAEIRDENNELAVSATLDYCVKWIKEHLV